MKPTTKKLIIELLSNIGKFAMDYPLMAILIFILSQGVFIPLVAFVFFRNVVDQQMACACGCCCVAGLVALWKIFKHK